MEAQWGKHVCIERHAQLEGSASAPLQVKPVQRHIMGMRFDSHLLECGESLAALNFWSAAIHCRFDIFWIAARPRAALDLQHVSCRFRTAVRPRTVLLWRAVQLSDSDSKYRSLLKLHTNNTWTPSLQP